MSVDTSTREILTAIEAARFLRIGDGRLLALIRSGEIPAADVSTRPGTGKARWRIRRQDLDAWLEGKRPAPPAAKITRRRKPQRPAGWIEYVK